MKWTWQRLRDAALQRWWRWAVPGWLRAQGVEVGTGLLAHGWPIVSLAAGGRITLGARVALCSLPRFTALGCNGPVILRAMRRSAVIAVGDDTGLSGTVICAAQAVRIGRGCLIGANVMIFDTDFHAIEPGARRPEADRAAADAAVPGQAVTIGDHVFIGTGCIICKGVSIGDGAVIGAGSVVTRDVPARHVAAGNPARVIRAIGQAAD